MNSLNSNVILFFQGEKIWRLAKAVTAPLWCGPMAVMWAGEAVMAKWKGERRTRRDIPMEEGQLDSNPSAHSTSPPVPKPKGRLRPVRPPQAPGASANVEWGAEFGAGAQTATIFGRRGPRRMAAGRGGAANPGGGGETNHLNVDLPSTTQGSTQAGGSEATLKAGEDPVQNAKEAWGEDAWEDGEETLDRALGTLTGGQAAAATGVDPSVRRKSPLPAPLQHPLRRPGERSAAGSVGRGRGGRGMTPSEEELVSFPC